MNNIIKLREAMDINNINKYIIPSSDPHQSEYVADYYKGRAYISGFTGSAGTLLVSKGSAKLWTDGRYFIQANNELKDSGIDLMKMRNPGAISLEEWIEEKEWLNNYHQTVFNKLCPFLNKEEVNFLREQTKNI